MVSRGVDCHNDVVWVPMQCGTYCGVNVADEGVGLRMRCGCSCSMTESEHTQYAGCCVCWGYDSCVCGGVYL
jgi:hypothetical protein